MLDLVIADDPFQRAASLYVRMQVFVIEQGRPRQNEFDVNDVPGVTYAVIYDGNVPVATGRFLRSGEDSGLVTRVAVVSAYRGQHLGTQIVVALERFAQNMRIRKLQVDADVGLIGFFERLGYHAITPVTSIDGTARRVLERIM